jgi:hypothetical protein
MPSYQGNRKINKKSSRKSSKGRSSRKSSRKSSKRRSSKNFNKMIDSVISDMNEMKPMEDTNQKNMPKTANGLFNPMNIDYDPMHVQYMVPQTNMEHLKQYSLGSQQMTQGPQMNGLSQMFQGMQQTMPQMQQPEMMIPQMQQPEMMMPQMQQPEMMMPQMQQPQMQQPQMQQPEMMMPQEGGSTSGIPQLADFSRLNISLAHM